MPSCQILAQLSLSPTHIPRWLTAPPRTSFMMPRSVTQGTSIHILADLLDDLEAPTHPHARADERGGLAVSTTP